MKRRYVLDGSRFATLGEFARYFSETVLEGYQWRGNLDAFNDILRGGFGTPEGGFVLVWRNHDRSRRALGAECFDTLVEIIRAQVPVATRRKMALNWSSNERARRRSHGRRVAAGGGEVASPRE